MKEKEAHVQRAPIIDTDRPPRVSHKALYGCWMVALCLRLRWARENLIRSLFRCLGMQFQVDTSTAEELAARLCACMDRDDSIIYVGFSFSSNRPYYGLVEARARHDRWAEQWRSIDIRQHQAGLAATRGLREVCLYGSEWKDFANGSSYPVNRVDSR